jgi:hypothetical protein
MVNVYDEKVEKVIALGDDLYHRLKHLSMADAETVADLLWYLRGEVAVRREAARKDTSTSSRRQETP